MPANLPSVPVASRTRHNSTQSAIFLSVLLFTLCGVRSLPAQGTGAASEKTPSFLESVQCAICHANSSRAVAMRDAQKRGIAPYDLWRSSAMANSTRDPFWRAVVSAEVAATPSQKALIEEKCTRCHAPMAAPAPQSPPGQVLAHLAQDDQRAWLGIDGVSCTLCHQIRDEGLGTDSSFTGHFILGKKGPIFGPHADPFFMPMQHHTGYTPTHSQHVLKSGLCGTCHTLDTDAVKPDGTDTGHRLHEQSPYLEWRNSVYNDESDGAGAERKSCQPLDSEKVGGPLAPHYQQIRSSSQAQVYQSVMADADGQATFTLLRGARYLKDNRLLPRGWRPAHPDAQATAPVGTDEDADFAGGQDTVFYTIPVHGQAPYQVHAWLHYQVLSPRHAAELFAFDTPEVTAFRQLYGNTKLQPETLATASQTVR